MQMSRSEINEQLESILSFADIGSFIDQPIRAYSSGMHVRLAFSAAIHVNPDVLLIDEALAVGDPAFQLKCFEKIAGFKKNGKTIIFVSHDINAITQFCDRVFVLTHGQLAFDGKPLDAINVYKSILFSDGRLQPTHLPITRPSVDEALVLNKHEKRFGNGEAEIFSVKLCDTDGQPEQIFRSNERACITFNVRGHQTVSDPVYGIRIKDKHGLQAYVDNTLHHQLSCPALNCGATQEITFRLKLHLASGDYFITVGISEFRNGNLAVLDRRNDVIQFKVLGADGLGIANLESVVEIK
jgi:teichoic acid transport system ATP-binding protein